MSGTPNSEGVASEGWISEVFPDLITSFHEGFRGEGARNKVRLVGEEREVMGSTVDTKVVL